MLVKYTQDTKDESLKILGPKGVAVDRSGHLVVVDSKQSCIFVFQPGGKLVQNQLARSHHRLGFPQPRDQG